jgi:transcription elongation factor Elf1
MGVFYMSDWIDQKYIGEISHRLEKFKRKDSRLYNFRCPLCGDSSKNKTKTRGYLYAKKGGYFYKCHNCGSGMNFGNFLKNLDKSVYDNYVMERYKEGETGRKPHKTPQKINPNIFSTPSFSKENKDKRLLDKILTPLNELPDDNIAVQYAKKRKIPVEAYSKLYYISNIADIEQLSEKYKDRILGKEPRLCIPFYNERHKLIAVVCRALGNESLRYVSIKIDEDAPLIYGMDELDFNEDIYVVEGPIDSLFIKNSVAVSGSDLKKVQGLLPKEKTTLVFDNQPRNKEVIQIMNNSIDLGFSVCIWDQNETIEKDINDMVMSGLSTKNVVDIIKKSTYNGAAAKLALSNWKRC